MGGFLNFSLCIAASVALYHNGYLWIVWLPIVCAVLCLWTWLAMRHRAYAAARLRVAMRSRASRSQPAPDTKAVPMDEDLDNIPNWIVDINLLATSVAIVFLLWQVTISII